jgi:hypothetical protein
MIYLMRCYRSQYSGCIAEGITIAQVERLNTNGQNAISQQAPRGFDRGEETKSVTLSVVKVRSSQ